ncbi:MAG TPA: metalloregulator ArsR/SmtB family transcription factor [Flavobacteriales bacterium]|nr:metalloregulator ArsR/SmtB family transcription factor [Flavobacteriales bacterium]
MGSKEKKIGNTDLIELTGMVKALAHPSRVTIVYMLCRSQGKKMTVKEIYKELKMAQPVISRHLSILKNSGLLLRNAEGNSTYYILNENNKTAVHIVNCFLSL